VKELFFVLITVTGVLAVSQAGAEWVNLSNNLDDLDIRAVAASPRDPATLFAASDKALYRTVNDGKLWNEILRLNAGDDRVGLIYISTIDPTVIYVCAERGIYRSKDNGSTWAHFFIGSSDGATKVFCAADERGQSDILWIGTDHGLFQMKQKTGEIRKVTGFPGTAVYSILLGEPKPAGKIIMTDQGIYRSLSNGDSWEKVFAFQTLSKKDFVEENSLQQFGIEETLTTPLFSNLIFLADQNKFYAATNKGVLQGTQNASTWRSLEGQTLPDKKINLVASSEKTFYAATDRGVFQWDELSRSFHDIYAGLGSNETRAICYSVVGDYLLAATKKGVYRLSNPENANRGSPEKEQAVIQAREIADRFSAEPTVIEVQQAAIRYAEVNPEKIAQWRKAAALRAWAPALSFHQDASTGNNVNVDRGGTADPDRFITGPPDKSQNRYVTVSWALGDLIWNGDQTSIDSRSKLMVELRNDILNEVTHLYFERRRLQIEMLMTPAKELSESLQREIRLEELTANIDALTGGYFSKTLSKIQRV